jgi:hypothetical protein
MNARDFDYGVGDDVDNAVRQLRAEIVERLEQAALRATDAHREVRNAYEVAIRIARESR